MSFKVTIELACDRGGFTGPYILGVLSRHGFALPMYVLGGCNLLAACILLAFRIPAKQGSRVVGEAAVSSPQVLDAQKVQHPGEPPACPPTLIN